MEQLWETGELAELYVDEPGLQTTIQDQGRIGYQQYGMPVAGVMDRDSYLIGQALVGNQLLAGALECTLRGPSLTCRGDCILAFTGADMKPLVNDQEIPLYTAVYCRNGDRITCGYAEKGMRMYISIAGGINVPLVNGSASTHTKACIGGLEGRKLTAGDRLIIKSAAAAEHEHSLFTWQGGGADVRPHSLLDCNEWDFEEPIRVVAGPQHKCFTKKGIQTFFHTAYELTPASDRMGYRLAGEPVEHEATADIISDGTVFGSIQIPADGQPIILMADRQTTGGYTKIGTVISSDLPRLAQLPIGRKIEFKRVSVMRAQAIYQEYQEKLRNKIKIAAGHSHMVYTNINEPSAEITVNISPDKALDKESIAAAIAIGLALAAAEHPLHQTDLMESHEDE